MDVSETFSSQFFERAPLRAIVEKIQAALRTKTGFSLVRLGEGEGPVLCWPADYSPDEMAETSQKQFGRRDLTAADFDTIAAGLRDASRSADVLGLSTRYQMAKHPRYGMVLKGLDLYGLMSPRQIITDSAVHWYLQWSGAIKHLLLGLPTLDVIGCRDIGSDLADAFEIPSVRVHLVRSEEGFLGPETSPHWPDGFAEIMDRLTNVAPGQIFLVGAGVLGKAYCDRIKAGGGVAIDVGSLLDSWAGVPSRPRYEAFRSAFTLDYLKSVGDTWDEMWAALDRCAKSVHAVDSTLTY